MHAEDARQCFPNSSGVDSPAKNNVAVAAAKNRQKSLLNENLASSSGLVAASPLHFNWQSNRSCVSERVRSLFANTTLADVYFNIHYQPGCDGASTPFVHNKSSKNPSTSRAETLVHRIPAHTFVLAISSAVFEAMFYGPMSVQGTAATAAGKSQQSPHKCSEQPAARQSSWSPSAGVFSMLSAAEPMEDIHVESTGDVDPAELGKVEHTQPVIFNPSSSQITSSSAIGNYWTTQNSLSEIHLDDVNPVAFTNVLRFIYTDEIQIDASNVLQTLYVAKKYAINVMEIACVDFLSQAITVDNAFMLLGQANFFDEQELAQKCLEFFHAVRITVPPRNKPHSVSLPKCYLPVDSSTVLAVFEKPCPRSPNLCGSQLLSRADCRAAELTVALASPLSEWSLVIDKNTAKALDTEDFLALDSDLLRSILERDTLCIREVRLFVSVVKWAEAEYHRLFPEPRPSSSPPAADEAPLTPVSAHLPSLPRPASDTTLPGLSDVPMEALRDILQPLLPHIRFPQMSIEEFADVVVPSGVLEDSMAVKIFQHFITSKTAKPELPFLKRPRCYLHGVEEIVRRFSVVDQRWDYRGTSDRIRFKVDRKIYVVGFGLYGSIHGQSEYEASIEGCLRLQHNSQYFLSIAACQFALMAAIDPPNQHPSSNPHPRASHWVLAHVISVGRLNRCCCLLTLLRGERNLSCVERRPWSILPLIAVVVVVEFRLRLMRASPRLHIVHPESGVVLGSNDVTYLADGSPNTFRVAFKEPIPLTPNVNYLASATIKGQDTYYGTRGLREITHECSTGSKVTFHFSYAACMNNGTSVEDGQIPEIVFFV
ncbi:unnamed protein product [Mesocestoides corti]|uniref:BTB domain-containing protein n=1 Tax=Mesocestoides corti TaxID=53468 RepID=A0A158QTI1_MESCO|nr:unnamed protein product [Mesocestoides corti]